MTNCILYEKIVCCMTNCILYDELHTASQCEIVTNFKRYFSRELIALGFSPNIAGTHYEAESAESYLDCVSLKDNLLTRSEY